MTTRTITIPAPEWREEDGMWVLMAGTIVLGHVHRQRNGAWLAASGSTLFGPPVKVFGRTRQMAAKAWAESRALELLGVKERRASSSAAAAP